MSNQLYATFNYPLRTITTSQTKRKMQEQRNSRFSQQRREGELLNFGGQLETHLVYALQELRPQVEGLKSLDAVEGVVGVLLINLHIVFALDDTLPHHLPHQREVSGAHRALLGLCVIGDGWGSWGRDGSWGGGVGSGGGGARSAISLA